MGEFTGGGFLVIVVAALSAFLMQREHFLTALLALELVVVSVVVILMVMGMKVGERAEWLVFILLAMGVCEASLGLGLLVAMVRAYGNDLMKSLSVHKV